MEKVRLGILGVGNMGTAHLKNIKEGKCPEIEVTAVCDLKQDRLDYVKENYGDGIALYKDAEEMMSSGLIDALLVAVPHYDHPRFVMAGIEKGLHVMCEKPAGVYTKHVKEMNAYAKAHNVKFGMMFNQRTNCLFRKMKEIIDSGELGEIRRTNWIITDWYRPQAYYDSGNWRATWKGEGGGVLLNQCPHNLDLWQWICGMPKKVTAFMQFGKWHDIEVEDDVTAVVEYENGATGTFITTTGDTPGTNRFEITLEGGKLVAEGGKLYMWKLAMLEPEFSKINDYPFASPDKVYSEVETDGKHEKHPGVLNAFAGAILRDEPMIADGTEGINGLTLSNAMHLSAWLGKTVELPFDDDLYYEELMKRVATSRLKTNEEKVFVNIDKSYGS